MPALPQSLVHVRQHLPVLLTVWTGMLAVMGTRAAAQQGPPATPVGVGEVLVERVQRQQMVTGELRSKHRSRVASEEPGLVVEMRVVEGQAVDAGEVLAVLNAKRLEIEVAQATGDLAVAQALVSEREADVSKSRDDAEALRTIFEQRAANAKEVRDAEADVRIAEARLVWAERSVAVTQSRKQLIEKRLADMTIKAPYDGIVVMKHVEVGEWLAEGGPVVDLVSTGQIEAWLDVPQTLYAGASAAGVNVTVNVEATDATLSTKDKRVVPLVDARARTFTLIATLPNEGMTMAPGMALVAWVPSGTEEEHLTLPSDAILRNESGAYVYVSRQLSAEGPPQAVPVKVRVLYPWGQRRVVESADLAAGERVVTEGNERLFPMAPLRPMEKPVVSSREGDAGAME